MEILRIEDLSFAYPNAQVSALQKVSLCIEEGSFNVICGESGCGKTTLLKMLKRELTPVGLISGKVFYKGAPLADLTDREAAETIGYVLQNPENQIVTDKVWHELAFGLENLGVEKEVIRRRVGEMASYFGIADWFRKSTDALSGGQKQLLNLAAVMVMQPKILILDEPCGQLDPIAASDFIATLQKMNRELGLTVILTEHRLEEIYPIADQVFLMEQGKVLLQGRPEKVGAELKTVDKNHRMLLGLPSAVRIFGVLNVEDVCPLTVKEGRAFLQKHCNNATLAELPSEKYNPSPECALELRQVWFRYERELPDVLRGVDVKVQKGEIYCILGGNGTGKTTMLNVLAGLLKPYRGKVLVGGKNISAFKSGTLYRNGLALLPQNPQTVFLKQTVREDLREMLTALKVPQCDQDEKILSVAERLSVPHLLERHPYDLSGGEQQKCALAKLLLTEPEILLLDEPTKGFDAYSKVVLADILKQLKKDGITTVIVTHDVEFAAENADRCALFFAGELLSGDTPQAFFGGNSFYTTAANRIARPLYRGAVTCTAVTELCRLNGVKE